MSTDLVFIWTYAGQKTEWQCWNEIIENKSSYVVHSSLPTETQQFTLY